MTKKCFIFCSGRNFQTCSYEKWFEKINQQDKLIELSEIMENRSCVEVLTNKGVFSTDEITIEVTENEDALEYFETIPIENIVTKSKWVKKKADPGFSTIDPDENLVWCLIEAIESYTFLDIDGVVHKRQSCPLNFTFNSAAQKCMSKQPYDAQQNTSRIRTLKKIEGQEKLSLIDWKLIKC